MNINPWHGEDGAKRAARLMQLWPEKSASIIAKELTREFGLQVGKSAVIGKARRLGIQKKHAKELLKANSFNSMDPRVQERRVAEKPASFPITLRLDPMPAHGVEFDDLERGQCRWPLGLASDPVKFFCAQPAKPDCPYCARHAAVAFGKPIAGPSYYKMIARQAA